jgi:methylglutaconyl-CoA hydratase
MRKVRIFEEDQILKVILSRPEVHNAFDGEMVSQLTEVFTREYLERDIRGVLLSAEGKNFSAGADLSWMKKMGGDSFEENQQDAKALFALFEAIEACPVPTLCRVQGRVFGGAIGLIASCDVVACEESAQFCFSETRIGVVPAVVMAFVRKKLSSGFLRKSLLFAQPFLAKEAQDWGLVHFVGALDEVDSYLGSSIGELLKLAPQAVRTTKGLLRELEGSSRDKALALTTETLAKCRLGEEAQEGLAAFLEKRPPRWSRS